MKTVVTSATKEVVIGEGNPTVLIGERINPTGKKLLTKAIKNGDMEFIRREAKEQVEAGADILDVNCGIFGVNEAVLLPQLVKVVSETVDVPICVDSNKSEAIAEALKVCPGKPLVNSVTGEEHSLTRILPLIKEYGCSVIGLLQDDEGLPKTVDRRLTIAHKIIERAEKEGIPGENVVIDPLVFAVGADPAAARMTLETIQRIKKELGVNMTMGASNVSFGMPERNLINSAFVTLAIFAGATSLIVDTARVRPAVLAADLLLERDRFARRYMADFRKRQKKG